MNAKLLLIGEKVAWTFAYQFVAVLFTVGTANLYAKQQWLAAADSAGYAALVALVTSIVTITASLKLAARFDALWRIVLTFGQSFAGSLLAGATTSFIHVPWLGALGVAVAATVPCVLKVLASLANPSTIGASVVPKTALV